MNRISFLNRGYAFKGLLAVIQVITYTSVTCYDFSELKIKIINSYKFLKFVNQVTIKFRFRKALT